MELVKALDVFDATDKGGNGFIDPGDSVSGVAYYVEKAS